MHGDNNTRYFHASAIIRNRRNSICDIQNEQGTWETEVKGIRRQFVNHYKSIYVKRAQAQVQQLFSPQLLLGLETILVYMRSIIEEEPTDLEIQQALTTLGPDKAAGPDGLNARAIQSNWDLFGPAFL